MGLGAGTYGVTVTSGTCPPFEGSYTIGLPIPMTLSCGPFTPTMVLPDSDLGVIITNGRPPFTVALSNGDTQNINGRSTVFTNLPKGTYTVTVTDADQCVQTCMHTIDRPECDNLDRGRPIH